MLLLRLARKVDQQGCSGKLEYQGRYISVRMLWNPAEETSAGLSTSSKAAASNYVRRLCWTWDFRGRWPIGRGFREDMNYCVASSYSHTSRSWMAASGNYSSISRFKLLHLSGPYWPDGSVWTATVDTLYHIKATSARIQRHRCIPDRSATREAESSYRFALWATKKKSWAASQELVYTFQCYAAPFAPLPSTEAQVLDIRPQRDTVANCKISIEGPTTDEQRDPILSVWISGRRMQVVSSGLNEQCVRWRTSSATLSILHALASLAMSLRQTSQGWSIDERRERHAREPGTTIHLGMDTPHEWIRLHHEFIGNRYCAAAVGALALIIYRRVGYELLSTSSCLSGGGKSQDVIHWLAATPFTESFGHQKRTEEGMASLLPYQWDNEFPHHILKGDAYKPPHSAKCCILIKITDKMTKYGWNLYRDRACRPVSSGNQWVQRWQNPNIATEIPTWPSPIKKTAKELELDYTAATSAEQRFLDCDLPAVAVDREIDMLEHLTRILEYRSCVKLPSFIPEASRNFQSAEMSHTHGMEHIVSSPPTLLPRFIFPNQMSRRQLYEEEHSTGGRIGSARRVIVKESSNSTDMRPPSDRAFNGKIRRGGRDN
ncbi:hypothetical protein EDD17DRAFT_1902523 [Pisolithus thermaeus]|nr:hypothetical protein EDD17DRAFT_1902523 [Pisolithus thermaeus]